MVQMIASAVRTPSAMATVTLPASARPVILPDHDLTLLPHVAAPEQVRDDGTALTPGSGWLAGDQSRPWPEIQYRSRRRAAGDGG
jgi:hypothetical protein